MLTTPTPGDSGGAPDGQATAPRTLDPERLALAIAATPGINDWQVETLHDEEAQLYLVGRRVESRRSVLNERARVVLYNDHAPHDQQPRQPDAERMRGASTLTLTTGEASDPQRLAQRLAEGVAIAGLTDSPPFALPEAPDGGFPAVQTVDPALAGDLAAALEGLRERLEAAVAAQQGVRLASAELYATRGARSLRNSRGLAGAATGTHAALDLVLIASEGAHEAEFHAEPSRRRLEDFAIEGAIAAYANFARDSLRAVAPSTYRGPVILSGDALPGLFTPLAFHASAQAAYNHVSRLTLGAPITPEPPRGDRLTLTTDALLPFGQRTAPFDADGVPAQRVPIVADGLLARYWADARYAAYLGVAPTGALANLSIGLGATPLAALRAPADGPIYEVVAFSFLNPDPVSGDFVAEIKLGYRHDATGSVPIKGGSLAGNLFSALSDARLSAEAYADGGYYGPAAIRFGALTIAGE